MGMVQEDHLAIPVCDCCWAVGRVRPTAFLAAYRARKEGWDVPSGDRDGNPEEGYVRCPLCVASDVWPRECCVPEWHGGPTIRLADGDQAADVVLGETPEALVTESRP